MPAFIASDAQAFRPDQGIAAYREAIAIAEAGDLRPLAAHAHLGAGRLHARTGAADAARARAALARARALFAACCLPEPHSLPND